MSSSPNEQGSGKAKARARLRKFAPPGLVLVAAVAVLVIWQAVPAKDRTTPPKKKPPVNVEVMRIKAVQELPITFKLSGVVEPDRVVKVAAEVAGRVEKLTCIEGRICEKGQQMIHLNQDLLKAKYDQLVAQTALSEAERDRAKAQKDFDEYEYNRLKESWKRKAAAEVEVRQAKSKLEASKAALAAAEAMVRSNEAAKAAAKSEFDRTVISSPIRGMLHRLNVEEGDYVKVGTEVAELVDIENAKIAVNVPELDISALNLGDQAEIITTDRRGVESMLKGNISYIGLLADEQTRTTPVEISVPNVERKPRLGVVEAADENFAGIRLDVPENAKHFYNPGGVVEVWREDSDEQLGRGRITAVSSEADEKTATVRVDASLPNKDLGLRSGEKVRLLSKAYLLRSGQIVRVRLTRGVLTDAIMIPLAATIPTGNNQRVAYVVDEEEGVARRRDNIKLGAWTGRDVQVVSGLKEGELLIIDGQYLVGPGDKVTISNDEEAGAEQ
ncbi:MAG: efflux RND transporter periplasmic adaptor subunit [Planctomycetota bacterium]|jgi:multidrug efflux system membrane fusion protein